MARKKSPAIPKQAPGRIQLKLLDIRLVESVARQFVSESRPTIAAIEAQVELMNKPNDTKIFICPRLVFSVKYKEKDENPAILAAAKYQLCYELNRPNDQLTKTEQESISNAGMWQAWPYFREYLQSQVARMGLPPLLLPLLNMPVFIRPDKEALIKLKVTKEAKRKQRD
jgi:hypothetical protein